MDAVNIWCVCVCECVRTMMDRRHFLKVPILWDNYNAMRILSRGFDRWIEWQMVIEHDGIAKRICYNIIHFVHVCQK